MSVNITGGTISYGETRKIAEYESKTAEVELAFNVPDGEDYHSNLEDTIAMAKTRCAEMLGQKAKQADVEVPSIETVKAPTKPHNKRAPKMPLLEAPLVADASVMDDVSLDVHFTAHKQTDEVIAPTETIISDFELMDATTKQQQHSKNPNAIRKLITACGVICPPGRLIDIAQDRRKEYLDGLKEIKPLA